MSSTHPAKCGETSEKNGFNEAKMVSVDGLTVAALTEAPFSCVEELHPCIQGGCRSEDQGKVALISSGAERGGDEL